MLILDLAGVWRSLEPRFLLHQCRGRNKARHADESASKLCGPGRGSARRTRLWGGSIVLVVACACRAGSNVSENFGSSIQNVARYWEGDSRT